MEETCVKCFSCSLSFRVTLWVVSLPTVSKKNVQKMEITHWLIKWPHGLTWDGSQLHLYGWCLTCVLRPWFLPHSWSEMRGWRLTWKKVCYSILTNPINMINFLHSQVYIFETLTCFQSRSGLMGAWKVISFHTSCLDSPVSVCYCCTVRNSPH